jgi:hypothetical protein
VGEYGKKLNTFDDFFSDSKRMIQIMLALVREQQYLPTSPAVASGSHVACEGYPARYIML